MPGGAAIAPGWEALRAGHYAEARALFTAAAGLNLPEPYLGLGMAALAEGRYAEAERALRTALFVPGAAGPTVMLIHFGLGQVWAAQSRSAEAIEAYETGLALVAGSTSEGLGQVGAPGYGWFVFNRASILPDILPGVVAAVYSDEAVAAMIATGDQYALVGSPEKAKQWYCQALGVAPDSDLAQARTSAHGGCPAD
jgi:tetratricopeptide (TPR) repeat protein